MIAPAITAKASALEEAHLDLVTALDKEALDLFHQGRGDEAVEHVTQVRRIVGCVWGGRRGVGGDAWRGFLFV